jgi:hypothetical protein
MSAFLVSDAHLDALVTVALFGVAESTAASGRWFSPYVFNRPVCVNSASRLGELLLRENEASVNARYPNDKTAPAPAYAYPFNRLPVKPIGAVAALKLVKCYEYQACEHDGWDASDAKKFCSHLTSSLINSLPGYDAAPWAID